MLNHRVLNCYSTTSVLGWRKALETTIFLLESLSSTTSISFEEKQLVCKRLTNQRVGEKRSDACNNTLAFSEVGYVVDKRQHFYIPLLLSTIGVVLCDMVSISPPTLPSALSYSLSSIFSDKAAYTKASQNRLIPLGKKEVFKYVGRNHSTPTTTFEWLMYFRWNPVKKVFSGLKSTNQSETGLCEIMAHPYNGKKDLLQFFALSPSSSDHKAMLAHTMHSNT